MNCLQRCEAFIRCVIFWRGYKPMPTENLFIIPTENVRSQLPKKARHGRLCTHQINTRPHSQQQDQYRKNVQRVSTSWWCNAYRIFGGFSNYFQHHTTHLHTPTYIGKPSTHTKSWLRHTFDQNPSDYSGWLKEKKGIPVANSTKIVATNKQKMTKTNAKKWKNETCNGT